VEYSTHLSLEREQLPGREERGEQAPAAGQKTEESKIRERVIIGHEARRVAERACE